MSSNIVLLQSLRLLSIMAAIQLDEKEDKIEKLLFSSLMNGKESSNTLASSTWLEVSPKDTLITPAQCNSIWEQFQADILPQTQAFAELQAMKKDQSIRIAQIATVAGISILKILTGTCPQNG
ncbi:protein ROOT HAIR DEFECTIVE 3 homolog 1-like [Durio zibethinus]|uniref:Protein ROOT HAIR DEFECTIVE 3 homolog 1-like n=1 Tax=Durio zibethinus TaxID=66656 RepID=A0A6P6AHK2_DURZI|nr:protein ROOT HAIR DEFECTIVE 3 homolog 1-like [Durio zibethinus]